MSQGSPRTAPPHAGDWPEAIELIQRIETDGRVFEPELEGFALWPVVRLHAMLALLATRYGHAMRGMRLATAPLYAAWSALRRPALRRRGADFAFLSYESYRSVERKDGWWDVYLDDFANHPALRGRVLRCEVGSFPVSPLRTSAPRHVFTDALQLHYNLVARFARRGRAVEQADRLSRAFEAAVAELSRPLDEDERDHFRALARRFVGRFERSFAWYRRLFADTGVRAFALVHAYGEHGAVAAARAGGIPVVEFQHGVIHASHPGYVWSADARRHRARMPLPDRIATYGDFWTDRLLSTGFWQPDEVTSVGSTRLDAVRERSAPPRAGGPLRIVFTTQPVARAEIIPVLGAFLRLAEDAGLDFELAVKIHRLEVAAVGEYRALAELSDRVRIVSAYEGDTLALIADADVHASVSSTCHYESIGLGTPTVVLALKSAEQVDLLSGVAGVDHARDPAGLLRVLQGLAAKDERRNGKLIDAEQLFAPHAVENAVRMLEGLIAPAP